MSYNINFKNISASTVFLKEYSQQQIDPNETIGIPRALIEDREGTELDDLITAGSIQLIDDTSTPCSVTESIKIMNGLPDKLVKAGATTQVLQTDATGSIIWKDADHNKLQHVYKTMPQVSTNQTINPAIAMPLITDGVPFVSITITPVLADSVFYMRLKTTFQPTGNDNSAAAVLYRDGIAIQVFTTGRGKDKQMAPLDIDYLDMRPPGTADVTYELRVGLLYGTSLAYFNFDGLKNYFSDQWMNRKFEIIEYASSVVSEVV